MIDFFLERKAHHEQLDDDGPRERIAHETFGYTPVMIEHLFDEALLVALREGRHALNFDDVMEAKLTEEIGLEAAHDLHGDRPGRGGDPRGGPRDDRVRARQGPPDGDALYHQAAGIARAAGAQRRGGTPHADEVGARDRDRDLPRWIGGGGDVVGGVGDRTGRRPGARHRVGRPDGRLLRDGGIARSPTRRSPTVPWRARTWSARSWGTRRPSRRSRTSSRPSAFGSARSWNPTATSTRRSGTRCSNATSWSAMRSPP